MLLLEDDADLGRRIEQALQTRGYRTRWITGGDEAAAALAADAPIPAPLLLGGESPELDTGLLLGLIRGLRRLGRCRVIVLAREESELPIDSDAPSPMIAEAVAAGEVECVDAPLDVPALLQLMRHAPPRDGAERALALSGRPPRL